MKRVIRNNVVDIFLSEDFEHLMNMYGLYKYKVQSATGIKYRGSFDNISCAFEVNCKSDNNTFRITVEDHRALIYGQTCDNVDSIIDFIDEHMKSYDYDIIHESTICNTDKRQQVVNAAISSRDLTKNLVRVKSSNVWAYAINIRDRKDKTGDVITQFKGKNGGPGDIYMYYDVPVNLWRRWIGAPSKGHFFWQYIRNNFKYSKLTGNKRGVLPNAINRR